MKFIGWKLAACLILISQLSACATFKRGANVEFAVVTDPPGASVTTTIPTAETRKALRRQQRWNADRSQPVVPTYIGCAATPCQFEVSRSHDFDVTIAQPGYHPVTVKIQSGFGVGGSKNAAAGAVVAATSGYVVTYGVATAGLTAATLGYASGGAVSSAAGSAAASAAATVGLLVIGVDLMTGSMLEVGPNPLVVVMVPDYEPVPALSERLVDTPEKLQSLGGEEPATD